MSDVFAWIAAFMFVQMLVCIAALVINFDTEGRDHYIGSAIGSLIGMLIAVAVYSLIVSY